MLDILTNDIKTSIINVINLENQDKEQCGIIVNNTAIPLTNKHHEAENHFWISFQDLKPYQEEIQGVYHTHCKDFHQGILSYDDIRMAQTTGLPIILFHPCSNSWDFYNPKNPNAFPLINTNFIPKDIQSYNGVMSWWGRSDCFALARSFYLGMFGIDIGEFHRIPEEIFNPRDYNYQCPWIDENGHKYQTIQWYEPLKIYDLLAIAIRGGTNANHVAVMLPNNMILHAPQINEQSRIEIYGDFWRKRTLYSKRIVDVNNH
jgi:proteasome lid subunit RPN8/RPN11